MDDVDDDDVISDVSKDVSLGFAEDENRTSVKINLDFSEREVIHYK